ncbi:hypothetical protein [Endozoicomonas arenosclerae]|uniref:hypothetical protein n=1 Tax=Endozoicomonas arenosclerae TaxID=1633495 RepID=UPI000AD09543|nr:hypothetical protein [Endozoicomonas arenosclerae]
MSSSFSPLERSFSVFLSKFPFLKKFVKLFYTRLVYIRNRKNYKVKTISPVQAVSDSRESFFGYYDVTPENNDFQIFNEPELSTSVVPSSDSFVSVCIKSISGEDLLLRATSSSYNWQQGCRAHWINSNEFVFNDFDKDKNSYVCKRYNVKNSQCVAEYDLPVQSSFQDKYYYSLNYSRLMNLRADYGYRNKFLLEVDELDDLKNDGVWKVDYKTGKSKLSLSLHEVAGFQSKYDVAKFNHKVNHVLISPSGDKFIFMHRLISNGRRFDRLLLSDSEGKLLKVLSDNEMVSHCCWLDNNTVLGYLRGPSNKDAYWLIDCNTGKFTSFLDGALDQFGDGHPSANGDYVITDTYPDKSRMQQLILVNWKASQVRVLGEFFHGFDYTGETRCDLHPRFSPDGKTVYFDSVFSSERKLYSMNIESVFQ